MYGELETFDNYNQFEHEGSVLFDLDDSEDNEFDEDYEEEIPY